MDREVTRIVGVVIERRPAKSRWVDHVWRVAEVRDGQADIEAFTRLESRDDGTERYFAGNAPLTLYRSDTEAYRVNLAGDCVLYVTLRASETGPLPFRLHSVTANPYDVSGHVSPEEEIVDTVPMPPLVLDWVKSFCAAHHKEEPFVKRQRNKIAVEELKFSKEPIFARTARVVKSGDADD
ncbi:MAG: DUF3305 domain-containing protein [Propylenella sp.]